MMIVETPTPDTPRTVTNDIRLILADLETITFEENAHITYRDNGTVISSATKEVVSTNLPGNNKFNTFIVPKGKQAAHLTLEDGTKVWVNAGSTLKFPTSFAADCREISIEGEIYIEVAKDSSRPFHVKTSDMDVKVLGTRFNLSAYADDKAQSVVLVEGLVEVQSKDELKKKTLLPDHKLTMTKEGMDITQANPYDYISWKDGLLQFRSRPLSDIIVKLSRHYGIDITCEPDICNMLCTGKLILFDNPADVLETIANTIPLEKTQANAIPITYEISGRDVYIKKK